MGNFNHLMSPGKIGNVQLKNRIIMTSMGLNTSSPEGILTEEDIAFFEARAKGGVGLVQIGSVTIDRKRLAGTPLGTSIGEDAVIPQMKRLVDVVHKYGAKFSLQLWHPGAQAAGVSGAEGLPVYVPSIPPNEPSEWGTYHELSPEFVDWMSQWSHKTCEIRECSQEDIAHFIELYADAAERAVKAGVDIVEIHGGHGYLLHYFLNPRYNRRADQYGGSVENRARFYVEIIKAIRERVGNKLGIIAKMESIEYLVDPVVDKVGITNEDAIQTARLLEAAGADAIACTSYAPQYKNLNATGSHLCYDKCQMVPPALKIKKAVNIPCTVAGRVDPEDGERLIAKGEIDFIQMGRKLLADPELPNKIKEGRTEDIRYCVNCYTCLHQMYVGETVKCAINAACCHEREVVIKPAPKPKKILIIGGGPAGMEAARVAAMRGHKVTIVDNCEQLGGTVFFASVCTPTNWNIVTYLKQQLLELGVDVRLNTMADRAFVDRFGADEVILATGSEHPIPDIPGSHRDYVMSGDTVRKMITGGDSNQKKSLTTSIMMAGGHMTGILDDPEKIAKGSKLWMPMKKHIVLMGGGLVAVEMAEFLMERGRQVTILHSGSYLGEGLSIVRRWKVLHGVIEGGVDIRLNVNVISIGAKDVTYTDEKGVTHTVAADNVIVCSGTCANKEMEKQLEGAPYPVHSIGDCFDGITYIDGAIHSGNKLAREI